MGLKGDLESFGLPELFQSLAINQHTGLLVIRSPDRSIGIYFNFGEITAVSLGQTRAIRLGELLYREDKITAEQIKVALQRQKSQDQDKRLGEILQAMGAVTEEDIKEALTEKMEEEIYDVFFWKEADFEFLRDVTLENNPPEEFSDFTKVSIDTPTLVIEAMHRLDKWEEFQEIIPSSKEIFIYEQSKKDEVMKMRDKFYFDPLLFDGQHTLEEIRKKCPATIYEVYKGLVELYEKKLVRKVSPQELIKIARSKLSNGDFQGALPLYKMAVEIFSDRPDIQAELAKVYESLGKVEEANQCWLEAGKNFLKDQQFQKAGASAQKVSEDSSHYTESLEVIFQASFNLKNHLKIKEIGEQLGEHYKENEEWAEMAEVYENLVKTFPQEMEYYRELAEGYQKVGNKKRASQIYENLASSLEKQSKLEEARDIFKKILEVDPDKPFVETKIETLNEKIKKAEKQKRIIKVAVGAFLVISLLIGGGLYYILGSFEEQEAEAIFRRAKKLSAKFDEVMEKDTMGDFSPKDLRKMQKLYQDIFINYEGTDTYSQAKGRYEELKEKFPAYLTRYRKYEKSLEKREEAQVSYEVLTNEIKRLARKKKFKTIHQKIQAFARDYPFSTLKSELKLPLVIDSSPENANVKIDNKIYKTPCVAYYSLGKDIELSISKLGYETTKKKLDGNKFHKLDVRLEKKPIFFYPRGDQLPLGSLEQQPLLINNSLYLLSRDGNCYKYRVERSLDQMQLESKLTISQVGESFTEPLVVGRSWMVLGGTSRIILVDLKNYINLGAFPGKEEDLKSLSEEVSRPWNFQGKPVLINANSKTIGIVNRNQNIYFFELAREGISYKGHHRVLGGTSRGLSTSKSQIYFGTHLGRIHCLNVGQFPPQKEWDYILEGKILLPPVIYRNMLFALSEKGRMFLLDRKSGKLIWKDKSSQFQGLVRHRIAKSGNRLYIGTNRGELFQITLGEKPEVSKYPHEFPPITTRIVLTERFFYFGASKTLVVYNREKKKIEWSYDFPAQIKAPPLVGEKYVYVPCTNGRIYCFYK